MVNSSGTRRRPYLVQHFPAPFVDPAEEKSESLGFCRYLDEKIDWSHIIAQTNVAMNEFDTARRTVRERHPRVDVVETIALQCKGEARSDETCVR